MGAVAKNGKCDGAWRTSPASHCPLGPESLSSRALPRRLRVLNANNLVVGTSWPRPFPKAELTAQAPVLDWKSAFGAKGPPERFYPHRLDFASARSAGLADGRPLGKIVPRWGQP